MAQGAVKQQAITWANVDPALCRPMASLGHNEVTMLYQTKNASWQLLRISNMII